MPEIIKNQVSLLQNTIVGNLTFRSIHTIFVCGLSTSRIALLNRFIVEVYEFLPLFFFIFLQFSYWRFFLYFYILYSDFKDYNKSGNASAICQLKKKVAVIHYNDKLSSYPISFAQIIYYPNSRQFRPEWQVQGPEFFLT